MGTSIGELANIFCEVKGLSQEVVKCKNKTGNKSRLVLSNETLFQYIGWKPKYTVSEGIMKTLQQLKEKTNA